LFEKPVWEAYVRTRALARPVERSSTIMKIRRQIEVSGIVQGVGFRPYIYRLATESHLAGTIRNTSSGVTIEVQGPKSAVDDFVSRLPREAPPLARITGIVATDVACDGDREFRIIASHGEETVRTLISPDVATCDDCLRELFDPRDRRYRYPFINCTNCGPRFTIIRDIPYDRPRTSMAAFKMCAACQAEYDNPLDRRFHAQPNACWDCGPRLELWGKGGQKLKSNDPIADVIAALNSGQIVAIKSLGGFHLAADATNPAAVALLRERKRRVGKPFAVMVPNLEAAREFCNVSEAEAKTMRSIQRPIVLLRRGIGDAAASKIADDVAPGNNYLGVFLPYTPLHHLLLAEGKFKALIMTSGNMSEEPIAIANDEAFARLSSLADYFLVHNRDILLRCDDSVVRVLSYSTSFSDSLPHPTARALNRKERQVFAKNPKKNRGEFVPAARSGPFASFAESSRSLRLKASERKTQEESSNREKIQQLRRSRGFVPVPVFLNEEVPSVLAVGGELKNTICLTKGKHAFLSQHVGDLENLESYKFFEEAVDHLQKVLEIRPEIIAYDLHPDYFSTKWALQKTGLPLVGVQHHHAHIASCMAENHLEGKVIGFALDGTGYGTDGNIWGGEVLVAGYGNFERAAHFEYVPMPGGAAAIHEPWRMAVSYLAHHFGRDLLKMKFPFLEGIARPKLDLLLRALERRINSPLTSSCGRLFDAVAAIAGIRQQVTYEAQAAIELEMAIGYHDARSQDAYFFELLPDSDNSNSQESLADKPMHAEKAAERRQNAARGVSRGYGGGFDEARARRKNHSSSGFESFIIGARPIFEALVQEVRSERPIREISQKFHEGLVNVFVQIAQKIRERTSLNRVCLSGGTFNNLYLTTKLVSRLSETGFEVFTQNEVPAGDGGLSLGQALVAAHRASGIRL
jgi:hydrogenase maturation protein HypF